jgi:hypothetical protein
MVDDVGVDKGAETNAGALRDWRRTQAALPDGWQLDSLRCASEGSARHQRSDEWLAVAIGPDDIEVIGRGINPTAALADLLGVVTSRTV